MITSKAIRTIVFGLVLVCVSTATKQSSAANHGLEKLYKVQVEYWFFDTTHYHWSTYYETTDPATAIFVYNWLASAKDRGDLPIVAPNAYWRYIPVDVRFTWTYRLKPQTTVEPASNRYKLSRP